MTNLKQVPLITRIKNAAVTTFNQYTLYIIAALTICLPVALYFSMFSGDLSPKQEVWGQFGDFVGGILNPVIGLLTLVAVLLTYRWQVSESNASKRASNFQMFESTFFKIVDIHYQKIESMAVNTSRGIQCFEEIVCAFNDLVFTEMKRLAVEQKNQTLILLLKRWLNSTEMTSTIQICQRATKNCSDKEIPGIIEMTISTQGITLHQLVDGFFDQWEIHENAFLALSAEERDAVYKASSDNLYTSYGHIYGHYYRNMSMLFDHLRSQPDESIELKFGKMFRAQLSRNEISMLYINNYSSKCRMPFIDSCHRYKLFDDFQQTDIFGHQR